MLLLLLLLFVSKQLQYSISFSTWNIGGLFSYFLAPAVLSLLTLTGRTNKQVLSEWIKSILILLLGIFFIIFFWNWIDFQGSFQSLILKAEQFYNETLEILTTKMPEDNNFTIEAIDIYIKQFLSDPTPKFHVNPIKLEKRDNHCELDETISIGRCIPYLSYLKQKHHQLLRFQTTYEKTINYFKKASQKCEHVLQMQHCYKIMVK